METITFHSSTPAKVRAETLAAHEVVWLPIAKFLHYYKGPVHAGDYAEVKIIGYTTHWVLIAYDGCQYSRSDAKISYGAGRHPGGVGDWVFFKTEGKETTTRCYPLGIKAVATAIVPDSPFVQVWGEIAKAYQCWTDNKAKLTAFASILGICANCNENTRENPRFYYVLEEAFS